MKGMRAALHPSTMSTQSYHVGASGFYTIVGSFRAAIPTSLACDSIVVAMSTKSSFSRLSVSAASA
jgi:hypothetical protein